GFDLGGSKRLLHHVLILASGRRRVNVGEQPRRCAAAPAAAAAIRRGGLHRRWPRGPCVRRYAESSGRATASARVPRLHARPLPESWRSRAWVRGCGSRFAPAGQARLWRLPVPPRKPVRVSSILRMTRESSLVSLALVSSVVVSATAKRGVCRAMTPRA